MRPKELSAWRWCGTGHCVLKRSGNSNRKSSTKADCLSLHRGQERFADLGGLEALKSFCLRAMRRQNNPDPLRRPRGVMLLSPPGCGKSQFCKALGNETGRPTLILDISRLMGSLVGQSEERTRQALRTIDAMQPAVVMLDEVEKALSGAGSSGQTDSGVSARLFGTLLSWLNDRQSDVFVVCTCNDISKLPPEFARSERFDGVFFVDLPTPKQRQAIWEILPAPVRTRCSAIPTRGRTVDRCRSAQLLSFSCIIGCSTHRRGAERRAGFRHRCRSGRAIAAVGERPLFGRRRGAESTRWRVRGVASGGAFNLIHRRTNHPSNLREEESDERSRRLRWHSSRDVANLWVRS